MIITCSDFADKPDKPSCCTSCHEDADDYGYSLSGFNHGDDVEVCCAVCRWLDENPDLVKSVREKLALQEQVEEAQP